MPGHSAFYFDGPRALFVGDALCTLNPVTHRRGPQVMPRIMNESHAQALESLAALERVDADLALPGHGEPWGDGVAEAVRQARAAA